MTTVEGLIEELRARRQLLELALEDLSSARAALNTAIAKHARAYDNCWETQMQLFRQASGGYEPLAR